ncbi:DNA-processing protein DprA [Nisaea acidiphila]|uniref:DNA-processing protein DprA n=1 Tax=Nisaea acidiphila TaxID=1862145 RepID=A0A9J7AVU3_9PROT|nr:DNA-processing protein DprA [Nisaea acidiphila]UUX50922.1 DNA-processing protein DprA [Nisaea acidiphila]
MVREYRAPGAPDAAERMARLRLIRTENVGPVTFQHLLTRFGSATEAVEHLPDLARRGGRKARLKIPAASDIEKEITANELEGARIVVIGEPDYPAMLAQIEGAPVALSLMGHPHLFLEPSVSIVGARNASGNAIRFTERIAKELGAHGIVIVSGLARGIDTAAHQGALETGTVAVVAGGADIVYPPENEALRARIVAEGALVAEAPIGTRPLARHFPARNRIISGLTRATLVIEAAKKSGSLITARFAADQGREVCAVPGSPMDPRCAGSNGLLRDGAHLIERAEDVLTILLAGGIREDTAPAEEFSITGTPPQIIEEIDDSTRSSVLALLDATPLPVDEIIRRCQLSPPVVLTILLEAELAGEAERHPGNSVARRYNPP